MNLSDKELGMHRRITRRDFIDGVAAMATSSMIPASAFANRSPGEEATYPPLRTGLRGSHPGSFEVAHQLVWQGRSDWGARQEPDADVYDLIVVGAGISGLTAAFLYRQSHPDASILILDNHDDFGGHAKRNEFEFEGQTIIGYGGSQALEDPGRYSADAGKLLREIGVDTNRFETAYDQGFFFRHKLAGATFFDRQTFGEDKLVPYSLVDYAAFLPIENGSMDLADAIAQMPLSENARRSCST